MPGAAFFVLFIPTSGPAASHIVGQGVGSTSSTSEAMAHDRRRLAEIDKTAADVLL
jgi:hypothetical protein